MKNLTANSMKLRAIFALFAGVTWLNAPSTPAFADSSPQAQLAVSQDLATSQKHKKKRNKPNILAVLTDDVGIDQVPLYGFHSLSVPATPNLEALQGAGLTFRNAWTMPACSTARGVLYTGRYPFRTELQAALGPSDLANSMISPYEQTIPKLLHRVGYATALFGKFHVGLQGNSPFGYSMPRSLGWDYFDGWLDETGDPSSIDTSAGLGETYAGLYPNGYVPGSNYDGADTGACYAADTSCQPMSAPYDSKNPPGRACRDSGGIFVPGESCTTMPSNVDFTTLSAHYVSPLVINNGDSVEIVPSTDKRARTFRNVEQTDAAIAWINAQTQAGRPWFATYSTATVHTPMQVPPIDTLPADAPDANGADTTTTAGTLLVANQMIQAMDHEFGRLLLNTGLAKEVDGKLVVTAAGANTVIIYVNDNGSMGTQVRAPFDPTRAKGSPYQTGVWTPVVVAGTIVRKPGRTVDGMINIADLYEFIGTLGGVNVREANPRRIDSVPMMPYFLINNLPSIRKYDFTFVGPNLQADGAINGPCQFTVQDPPTCSQIPVTKGVCEDNGGIWFGQGADASYPTPDGATSTTPIPSEGFKYCCQVQQWINNNGGTPGTVIPTTAIGVRDRTGFKLVRNEMNDYNASTNECQSATYNELYVVKDGNPPLIDRSDRMIPTPYTQTQQLKYNELSAYMNRMLASAPGCLAEGDGNNDGVVNQQDILNYNAMVSLTSGSSWYDVNTDGSTNSEDQQIISQHLGYRCKK
ncbi:sulfatase-like hydrolase/transferase [Aestuariivirga sp.]|uniref:sulfatase-like hydrolase/transferase n=1 Tax=Aestuariivirga sp. TaxID=2650926 RepID=UPI00301AAFBB